MNPKVMMVLRKALMLQLQEVNVAAQVIVDFDVEFNHIRYVLVHLVAKDNSGAFVRNHQFEKSCNIDSLPSYNGKVERSTVVSISEHKVRHDFTFKDLLNYQFEQLLLAVESVKEQSFLENLILAQLLRVD